jgi:hypothetical protein
MAKADGSTNGYLASADWTTFNDKLGAATSFSGDVSGAYNATSVDKIKGKSVSAPTLSGQVLRYDGTNITPNFVAMGDLRSNVTGSTALAASCDAAHTLTYNSASDNLTCTAIGGLDASAITTGTIANGQLPASATAWTVSGSDVYRASGNVGIGTTSPQAGLDISSGTTEGLRVTTTNATPFALMLNNATYGTTDAKGFGFYQDNTGYGSLRVNGNTSQLILSPTGNVGIGTTNPLEILHISGADPHVRLQGTNTAMWTILNDTTVNNPPEIQFMRARGGPQPSADDSLGRLIFMGEWKHAASVETVADAAFSGTSSPGRLTFSTTPADTTTLAERMRITSAGNVGIGSTIPRSLLDVNGSVKVGADATACSATIQGAIRLNGTAIEYCNGTAWTVVTTGGAGTYLPENGGGTVSGNVTITPSAGTALTITSGGASITGGVDNNSGGITNAGSITGVGANVTGSSAVTIAAGGAAQDLTLSSSTTGAVNIGSGNGTSLKVLDGGAGTVNYLTAKGATTGNNPILAAAGSDANIGITFTPKGTGASIFSAGNVGIGTTSPQAALHVMRTTEQLRLGYDTNFYSSFVQKDNGDLLLTNQTKSLYVGDYNASPALFVAPGGVGIGTNSLGGNRLDVVGSVAIGTNSGISAPTNGLIVSGNVGIGTTTPTAALQLKAGAAAAGGAPLKLTAGTNLTAPEAGAIEFDGTSLYFTDSTPTRRALNPIYVIGGTFVGTLATSQVLTQHPFPVAVTIPAGCTNSRFEFATAATAGTTMSLKKCTGAGFTTCTEFGTAVVAASGTVAAFTCAASTSFTAGTDSLLITAPVSADATAATAGWAIYGTR